MRTEKKYLVEEVDRHLAKSSYVYLVNYTRLTVSDTADLRALLSKDGAEFHVVKSSILLVAAQQRELPDLAPFFGGQIAIIVGGKNPAGVAKTIGEYFKAKEKVEVKGGVLDGVALTPDEVKTLAALPPIEVLKAQLLGLLNTPAQGLVTVLNAVPQSILNVLQAHSDKGEAA